MRFMRDHQKVLIYVCIMGVPEGKEIIKAAEISPARNNA